jgi:hypothetical protein
MTVYALWFIAGFATGILAAVAFAALWVLNMMRRW